MENEKNNIIDFSKAYLIHKENSIIPIEERELYSLTDPCPDFKNGDIIEVYLNHCTTVVSLDQWYYEAVVIGRTWNMVDNRYDWIVDIGKQVIKDYNYQAIIVNQNSIVKDKLLN